MATAEDHVSRLAVIFGDEAAHWDHLHQAWPTYRINHSEAYSLDGASTNAVESYFSRLRRMVTGQHHGVSPKYLHQYASHAAWLEDHRRDNGANAHAVIGNTMKAPVSRGWAGYRQPNMNDPQVINTLRTKADELQAHIGKLETAQQRARTGLSHIEVAITLFQAPAPGEAFPLHFNLGMLFRAKELRVMLSEALATGPKDTRELGAHVIEKKGLDVTDKALRRSIQFRVVNATLQREKRGKAQRMMRRRGGRPLVWSAWPHNSNITSGH